MAKSPQNKQWLANTLLVLGSLGFAVVVAEVALRLMRVSYPSFYQVDPQRGHSLIPNFTARWTHEGNGLVSINSDGLRDRHYEKEKPADAYRIVVLGDSFSEAIQVNEDETYWSAIEKNLASCAGLTGKTVEVINFGVGDYGTAQEYLTLRHHAIEYQPDLVLLQIFTGNDIVNNSRQLSPGDRLAPFWEEMEGKWQMKLDFRETMAYQRRDSAPRRLLYGLINRVRLLQVLNEAKRQWVTQRTLTTQQQANTDIIPALDFDVNLYREPTDPAWEQAWAATESLITATSQLSREEKADFLAVVISNPPQVYPDRQVREQLKQLGAENLFYPDQRLAQLGQKENFAVLTLAATMQQKADAEQSYWHGFDNTIPGVGHWNIQGHQLAGQLIGDRLCQMVTEKGK
ncbi:SGNH/GDSL hydrolase family protein [Synechocystis salina]|uniref:SGNH/GDSL hydrolase family protein n=1 Tax=Synechocystis salina LEGE 00031 TaxID=1828736 RepID=A0ABR9VSA6_9SYNC|nr:SGNH/GDSL hydrolase family protein [Synechocystis salina]MBE9241132.1 SGNH/GDSL hydrolase family protein [Synechocystis salina LEGE 00041]MBE9254236.1 SGNH/GDSL hydrolase family protein [Synechocystis salina LEGE 00031]